MYYVLIYYVVDDFVFRRMEFRQDHLRLLRAAQGRGELLMAGALGDPIERALLVFRGPNRSAAEAFALADPYVTSGLTRRWEVQPWTVVIGGDA